MGDIMLDLETLGTAPGCVIRSIGAVDFDPQGDDIGDELYVIVDRASCEAAGLTVDPETERWWSEQSAEARAEFDAQGVSLAIALDLFDAFYAAHAPVADKADKLWSNGPSFDETILAAAYRALGRRPPWRYNAARDCRTIYDLCGLKLQHAVGTFHKAIDDAACQARLVQRARRQLLDPLGIGHLTEGERLDLTTTLGDLSRAYGTAFADVWRDAEDREKVLAINDLMPTLVKSGSLGVCSEYAGQIHKFGGLDLVLCLRVITREMLRSIASIDQSMARKHGYDFTPASFGLAAFFAASQQLEAAWAKEA